MSRLSQNAVLARFSAPLIPMARQDPRTTKEVQVEKELGSESGNWVAKLYPKTALEAIKKKQAEARAYHDSMSFPFGGGDDVGADESDPIAGIRVMPAAVVTEYRDRMVEFKGQLQRLVDDFLVNPRQWLDWAIQQHNGTFNPANYPGASMNGAGVEFDEDVYRAKVRSKIAIKTEFLPIPGSEHFSEQMQALLGVDTESVNVRVRDAETEAQRELLRRLMAPVRAMAEKLAEPVPEGKQSPIFRDSLVGNLREIASLAPKLNISGDPVIDGFAAEMERLARYSPDSLRGSVGTREEAQKQAAAMLAKMVGYKL